MANTYRFSEIFISIQGEGAYTGTPSVFVRFWGCNFTCAGFSRTNCQDDVGPVPRQIARIEDLPVSEQGCDSSYSWSP